MCPNWPNATILEYQFSSSSSLSLSLSLSRVRACVRARARARVCVCVYVLACLIVPPRTPLPTHTLSVSITHLKFRLRSLQITFDSCLQEQCSLSHTSGFTETFSAKRVQGQIALDSTAAQPFSLCLLLSLSLCLPPLSLSPVSYTHLTLPTMAVV